VEVLDEANAELTQRAASGDMRSASSEESAVPALDAATFSSNWQVSSPMMARRYFADVVPYAIANWPGCGGLSASRLQCATAFNTGASRIR